MGKCMQVYTRG